MDRRLKEHRNVKRKNVLIPVAMIVIAVIVVAGAIVVGGNDDEPSDAAAQDTGSALVRDESHRLSAAGGDAPVFVEFLDFECEACGAAYPAIEQLREQYGDDVQFVARYFPLPGHFNAERAARAVEAAAQQGQFEAMYQKMFDTQPSWGEQDVPLDDLFRSYAEELNLDMAVFDAAYDDPATLDRIQRDVADGKSLGVSSTPTFFLDGERLEPQSFDDLVQSFDAAIDS